MRAVRPLNWTECGVEAQRWWETGPPGVDERRAVVIWLRDLGKVAWWIAEGERTLALGFVESLNPPSEELLEQARRSAAQRWWEIYT
ncbi:hypothetical protein [Enhygromyxa salina]|nr:hypothetical protein [Enhygromyxa salina]